MYNTRGPCESTKLQIWGTAQAHLVRLEKRLKQILSTMEEEQKNT
jgi:hypothetical protein